jgi:hypothetical protein
MLQELTMTKLRRTRSESFSVPCAAELLESRALLSAGATAVHVATHGAAIPTQAIEPHTFHATVIAAVNINNSGGTMFPGFGKLTLSKITPTDGSKVTAKVSFPAGGPSHESLTATFTGTISTISVVGPDTFIALDPTGGSLTLKAKSGGHSITAKALPDASEWHLVLQNGEFHLVSEDYAFIPTAPGGLATLPISILVGFE